MYFHKLDIDFYDVDQIDSEFSVKPPLRRISTS